MSNKDNNIIYNEILTKFSEKISLLPYSEAEKETLLITFQENLDIYFKNLYNYEYKKDEFEIQQSDIVKNAMFIDDIQDICNKQLTEFKNLEQMGEKQQDENEKSFFESAELYEKKLSELFQESDSTNLLNKITESKCTRDSLEATSLMSEKKTSKIKEDKLAHSDFFNLRKITKKLKESQNLDEKKFKVNQLNKELEPLKRDLEKTTK